MTDLNPDFMALFSTQVYSSSEELTRDLRLSDVIPGSTLDSKIFEPCGYSLNAIVKVSLSLCCLLHVHGPVDQSDHIFEMCNLLVQFEKDTEPIYTTKVLPSMAAFFLLSMLLPFVLNHFLTIFSCANDILTLCGSTAST